jgi:ABC-type branched-subunit amino acid transport system ATPase component
MTLTAVDALAVDDLTVRFGGLTAVNDVSLRVPPGQIVGLIGPNGAGKTTIFNACFGVVRPSAGTIRLFGEEISHKAPSARARRGLGRTFQRMELYDRLTVGENVAMGLEAKLAGNRVVGSVWQTAAERRSVERASTRALDRCDLHDLADRRAGALSSGQRRLVELARALAASPRVLLLDEPSSGLDVNETGRFAQILRRSAEEDGITIALVEHDMALVRAVCDFAYVLDFGRLIEQGRIAAVLNSAAVRTAYLGEELA